MEDLSVGFLEALENDMERELEYSHISSGILENEHGLAPMQDWAESNKAQLGGRPVVPGFKAPPGSRGTAMSGSRPTASPVQRQAGDIINNSSQAQARGKQSSSKRDFDPNSFTLPDWTLARGWKNRPRKVAVDKQGVARDIALYKQRLEEAKKSSGPGFRFGVHGDSAPHQAFATSYEDGGSMGSSTTSTLRRLRHTLSSSFDNSTADLNSLSGPDKLSCIHFRMSTMAKFQPTYNPSDVQGILRRNRRSCSPDVAARQASRAGNRVGPGNQPILVPNSSSPLATGKYITFSACKRFPYDSDLPRRPKTRDETLTLDGDDWNEF